jgi:hypothetical protein
MMLTLTAVLASLLATASLADDDDPPPVYSLNVAEVLKAMEKFSTFAKYHEWRATLTESGRRASGPRTERRGGVQSEFPVGVDFSALR